MRCKICGHLLNNDLTGELFDTKSNSKINVCSHCSSDSNNEKALECDPNNNGEIILDIHHLEKMVSEKNLKSKPNKKKKRKNNENKKLSNNEKPSYPLPNMIDMLPSYYISPPLSTTSTTNSSESLNGWSRTFVYSWILFYALLICAIVSFTQNAPTEGDVLFGLAVIWYLIYLVHCFHSRITYWNSFDPKKSDIEEVEMFVRNLTFVPSKENLQCEFIVKCINTMSNEWSPIFQREIPLPQFQFATVLGCDEDIQKQLEILKDMHKQGKTVEVGVVFAIYFDLETFEETKDQMNILCEAYKDKARQCRVSLARPQEHIVEQFIVIPSKSISSIFFGKVMKFICFLFGLLPVWYEVLVRRRWKLDFKIEMREKVLVSLRKTELNSEILNSCDIDNPQIFLPSNPIVSNDGILTVMN